MSDLGTFSNNSVQKGKNNAIHLLLSPCPYVWRRVLNFNKGRYQQINRNCDEISSSHRGETKRD